MKSKSDISSIVRSPATVTARDTAVKSRGTIRALLLEGKSAGDVIEEVGRAIGGAKPF